MMIFKRVSLEDKNLERIINEILFKLDILFKTKTQEYVILQPLDKEPDKKYNGMIVFFNNVNGKYGFYGYEDGNWVKL